MRHYHGNEKVGPGIYFNARELTFRSLDDEGRLPGGDEDVWRAVPVVVMLLAGPVLGLLYAIFLPLVGFLMLGGVMLGWVGRQLQPAFLGATRVLRPAWEPALAFLGRGRAKKAAAPAKTTDAWADEVRKELEKPADEKEHES